MTQRLASQLIKVSIAGLAFSFVSLSYGSAFQLFEQDAGSLGTAHAGYAAEADNASTGFYNPAGLVRIKHQQLSVGGEAAMVSIKFDGTASNGLRSGGYPPTPSPVYGPVTGQEKYNSTTFIPNFNYAAPISDKWVASFNVGAPFGLETDWGNNSIVRYAQVDTKIQVINFGPSLAYAVNKHLSIGAGADFARLDATLSEMSGDDGSGADDFLVHNKGHAWGYGWHAGILYQFTPSFRAGISYRSAVDFKIRNAHSESIPIGATAIANQGSTPNAFNDNAWADTTMPATTALSVFDQISDKWALLGSAIYTQWSVIKDITLHNVQTPMGLATIVDQQNYRNTWYFAVGTQYKVSEKLMLKTGLSYDLTPVNGTIETADPSKDVKAGDTYRNLKMPDGNRIGVHFGLRYKMFKNLALDLSYAHLFVQTVGVHNTTEAGNSTMTEYARVDGDVRSHADIVGGQLIWDIT